MNVLPGRGAARRRFALHALPAVAVAMALSATAPPVASGAANTAARTAKAEQVQGPWLDKSQSPQRRAQELVDAMTLDEKIAMVHGMGIGLAGAGAGSIPGIERLGIPALALSDGPLGVANYATGVTQFPDATNSGATWDPDLVGEYGRALGTEFRGKGRNIALTPTIDPIRVPLWGRAFESFSEDPLLTSRLGVAEIKGIQSRHILATAKHFAAKNMDAVIEYDARVAERTLQEIYYPPFEAAVKDADVGSVMCAYNKVNGDFSCENSELLTTVLRDLWDFTGFVMSDWGGTHSTVKAANAGLDVSMPDGGYFGTALKEAVQNGQVPVSRLDQMVRRLLTAVIQVGLFDDPVAPSPTVINQVVSTPSHQQLATRLSQDGSVLLKNEGTLPLSDDADNSIAVIGYAAHEGATYVGGGSAGVTPSHTPISPLDGITERAGSAVTYSRGPGGPLPVLPADLVSAPGGAAGFTGTYYSTRDYSGDPIAVRTDATIDFGVGRSGENALPVPGAQSVRWEGTLNVPSSGEYRFTLNVLGNAQLYVDDQVVVDARGGSQGAFAEGAIDLAAGDTVTLRVDYLPFSVPSYNVLYGRARLGARTPDDPNPISQAAEAARTADVAVVFAADRTSEGSDRTTLALPGEQDALITAVADANPNTVVVLNTAGAVTMPWLSKVRSVLEVWYPGQEYGTALASLLFGDVSPSGKLPVTFPADDQQGPWGESPQQYPGVNGTVDFSEGNLIGYRWYDAKSEQPLFPFGHGLSYTSFSYKNLNAGALGRGARAAEVGVLVKNTGKRPGAEVVQFYIGHLPTSVETEPKQLVGFEKVYLKPGQQKYVKVRIDRRDLSYWNADRDRWITPAGTVQLQVGGSSRDLRLTGSLRVR